MTEHTAQTKESVQPPALQSETVAETGRLSLQQLMWRQFLSNRLAVAGGIVLVLLYLTTVVLTEFIAPYHPTLVKEDYVSMSPQLPRFVDQEGQFHLRPFVYGTTVSLDSINLAWVHEPDYSIRYPVLFFTHGTPYKLFGVIPTDIHLFGVQEPGTLFIFGSDGMGRCVFSRAIYGGRVSLTIGLIGVVLTVIFGSSLGTISGYYGGMSDVVLQRVIELLQSFPGIALWAGLAAALPAEWPPIRRFFAISVILSFVAWTGLARQVRAKMLAYREMDYSSAARAVG
ncbi:MAG: ABC transporter permease, partial [Chloroflexi bacterium]|nr:ABC transporter permease [Chloroflexota bacterium]